MEQSKIKVGVLTSSRADFGIYLPLLKQLEVDVYFDLTIIAFGTHGSPYHGETIFEIQEAGFKKVDLIQSLLLNDNPNGISSSYGLTATKFADYWSDNIFDLVFCLGDRFEMSAAVQAGIPYEVKFFHLYGGETTLGAIDDIYRHQITLASKFHFVSTEMYRDRVADILGNSENIFNIGSLSLDGIEDFEFMNENEFKENFNIPDSPYVLATFHPETINSSNNEYYASIIKLTLEQLKRDYFIVVTMPNADTSGKIFRNAIEELRDEMPDQVLCIENFGKTNYFNAMKYASFLIGNSSSGIVEAASFGKYVINVGDRQKGRARSNNIIDCDFDLIQIINAVEKIKELGGYQGENVYQNPKAAKKIIEILRNNYASL